MFFTKWSKHHWWMISMSILILYLKWFHVTSINSCVEGCSTVSENVPSGLTVSMVLYHFWAISGGDGALLVWCTITSAVLLKGHQWVNDAVWHQWVNDAMWLVGHQWVNDAVSLVGHQWVNDAVWLVGHQWVNEAVWLVGHQWVNDAVWLVGHQWVNDAVGH